MVETTLETAKATTEWLQAGGGWAMFVLACGVIVFLWRVLVSDRKECVTREDALRAAHKAEMEKVQTEHSAKLEEKDDKLFALLDKTNETLNAIQQLKQR